jgi:hypothetical protein
MVIHTHLTAPVVEGIFIGAEPLLRRLGTARLLSRMRSWENGVSPADSRTVIRNAREHTISLESVYDAAHGRRYLCFVYQTAAQRAACWEHLTCP